MTTIQTLYSIFLASKGICTDTRTLEESQLFFALKGDNFDGNRYAEQALKKGAIAVVVDDKSFEDRDSNHYIYCNDVLSTLQHLATYHRQQLKLPVIALTGSNGKTTTKELIREILATQYKVKATVGNLNNHIGVPLTLLSFTKDTEIGIVEMGANHIGEIANLSEIAQPNYGYITNIGKAHLEGFGSEEGILQGKTELYAFLKTHNQTVIVNYDDEKLWPKVETYPSTISFSLQSSHQAEYHYVATLLSDNTVQITSETCTIASNLIGGYNSTNLAAAITIGRHYGISLQNCKDAIENYVPSNNRSQVLTYTFGTVILDAYNANPTSTLAALQSLEQTNSTYRVAILGDMFELGAYAEKEHQRIVEYIEDSTRIHQAYVVGALYYQTRVRDSKIQKMETLDDLPDIINGIPKDCTLLIKGSRGMRMERLLTRFDKEE